jgi:lipid-binding SYLF domain-containing protein
MVRYIVACCVVLGVATLGAQHTPNKEQSRLENCGVVMEEILNVPENIPQELLEKAECVIVIPSMIKVAVGVGGSYGRGAMVCRSGKAYDGAWGAPAMYALDGGSFGLQLGAEATDLVLLVMNPRGANALLSTKVKLGGNASAAAGPKGRTRWKRRLTRRCEPRSSATPGRAACSPACRSRAPRFAPTTTLTRRSTGAPSRRGASSRGRP